MLVVLQWRLATEDDFPDLPATREEIERLLDDPEARRELQIATEMPLDFEGRVAPVPQTAEDGDVTTRVRLPEVARTAAGLLARGMEGRDIEILRHANRLERVPPEGQESEFSAPVAAIPVGDGTTALVLERPGAQAWRLREVELATGRAVRTLVDSGKGEPWALVQEVRRESVLVAAESASSETSDDGQRWALHRVPLDAGDATVLFTLPTDAGEGGPPRGRVKGLLSLGTNAALLTVADSLVRVDYFDGEEPKAFKILGGFEDPHGIVLDPLRTNRLYLAERGAEGNEGRVVSLEINSLKRFPVVANGMGFPRPQALALERRGARLLVVTDDPGVEGRELRGLELGLRGVEVYELARGLEGEVGSLATGPDGLRVLTLTAANKLGVVGGVEQRREIVEYDPRDQVARVREPFDPALKVLDRWRIRHFGSRLTETVDGVGSTFVWDSRDVVPGSDVIFRAVPFDTRQGVASSTLFSRTVARLFDEQPKRIGKVRSGDPPFYMLAVGDLNGDGAADFATTNYFDSDDVTVFYATGPWQFAMEPPLRVPPVGGNPPGPIGMDLADFDRDGDLDLVTANMGSLEQDDVDNLTIFLNQKSGFTLFQPPLGGPMHTKGACTGVAADLDANGFVDLVSSNCAGGNVSVFFQRQTLDFDRVGLEIPHPDPDTNPGDVVPGDFNGDGDLDLAVCWWGDSVTIMRQESEQRFVLDPVPESQGVAHWAAATADLDADGDLDLVSTQILEGTMTVFEQKSGRLEIRRPVLQTGPVPLPLPFTVAAADLDGDGDPDLATATLLGDNLLVFFQRPSGDFRAIADETILDRPFHAEFQAFGGTNSLAAEDADGDGDLDLVLSNPKGPQLSLYRQPGPGDFSRDAVVFLRGAQSTANPSAAVVVDLDGDGDRDLVSANGGGDSLTAIFQTAPGVFASDGTIIRDDADKAMDTPVGLTAADLAGEGDGDVVSANRRSNNLTVFLQGEPGSFAVAQRLKHESLQGPESVHAADLDGDGDVDLVSANSESNNLTIFCNQGAGMFAPTATVFSDDAMDGPVTIVAADLDADGDLDLVSTNNRSHDLTVFRQTDPGIFTAFRRIEDGRMEGPASVIAVDLDGDGRLDLATANTKSNNVTVFLQGDDGEFLLAAGALLTDPSLVEPLSLVAADLDGDGDLDLVTANSEGDTLSVFVQTSPGRFILHPQGSLAAGESLLRPRSVVVADVDGDGDVDIVSANVFSNNVAIFYGGR